MSSNTPSQTSEKPLVYTDKEAWAALNNREKLPQYVEKLFGEKNIQSFFEVIKTPGILEIDILLLTGELTQDEFIHYAISLPNFNETRILFYVLLNEFMQEIEGKIPFYVGKSLESDGSVKSYKRGILDLIISIDRLNSILRIEDCPTFCAARIHELTVNLTQRLVHGILTFIERAYKGRSKAQARESLCDILRVLESVSGSDGGFSQANAAKIALHAYLNFYLLNGSEDYQKFLSEVSRIKAADPNSFPLKLKEVLNLSRFRKVMPFIRNIGKYQIEFSGDEDKEFAKTRALFTCKVNIKMNDNNIPSKFTNEFGGVIADIENVNNVALLLDAATGELHYRNSAICASEYIGEEAYAKLKTKVYEWLLEYLRNKEEDIEYEEIAYLETAGMFHSSKETITSLQNGTHESVTEVLKDEPEDKKIEKKNRIRAFASLSGNEVKQALTKLLGEPLRIRGSHHIFRGREGNTCPIALRGTDIVGIGMLLKSLKIYKIDTQEFYEML